MKSIESIMANEFGSGVGIFDPISILWASEKADDKIGVDAAKDELKKINLFREKHGLPVAVHSFGHRLF